MAVSNKDLVEMKASDKNSYLKLRKALDSFSDVALIEFDLFESKADREEIAEFVEQKIIEMLDEIAVKRQVGWLGVNNERAEKLEEHARKLRASATAARARDGVVPEKGSAEFEGCPPGFVLINGICVPI